MDYRRQGRLDDQSECELVPVPVSKLGPLQFSKGVTLNQAKLYLRQDLQSNRAFCNLWSAATKKYHTDNKKQANVDDDLIISVLAYTMEVGMLYKDLNMECRNFGISMKDWDTFPYKGWWCLLHEAVKVLPHSPPSLKPLAHIRCYRGVLHLQTFSKALFKQKELFCFNQFGSASTNENTAMKFTKGEGTLFEIDRIPLDALGIKNYSAYPKEEEILILPSCQFQVTQQRKEGNIMRVKLSSVTREKSLDEDRYIKDEKCSDCVDGYMGRCGTDERCSDDDDGYICRCGTDEKCSDCDDSYMDRCGTDVKCSGIKH